MPVFEVILIVFLLVALTVSLYYNYLYWIRDKSQPKIIDNLVDEEKNKAQKKKLPRVNRGLFDQAQLLLIQKENEKMLSILSDFEKSGSQRLWPEFQLSFNILHPGFYEKLSEEFPTLTPNEKRLCAFLRLNLSTKEISTITKQTPRSIDIARTRLRNKLNLTNTQTDLNSFLEQIEFGGYEEEV